jgi:hypothetical protein
MPFASGIPRLTALVALWLAMASCSGDVPNTGSLNTVWRGGSGERGYSADGWATPIVDLIRERDIRTPDQSAVVPLLEQLRRELAKSDPGAAYAGATYDLTSGNSLPKDWLVQSPARWGRRADDLPFYPFDCRDCDRDVMLPACHSDADCPGGGTCSPCRTRVFSPRSAPACATLRRAAGRSRSA